MTTHTVSQEPFGVFEPTGKLKLWVNITRGTFLGRGYLRRKTWQMIKHSAPCYDLMVRDLKMRLYPGNNSVEKKLILRPDRYCPEEIGFLQQVFAKAGHDNPMTYLDIGANIGALTLPVAANKAVRVIAVEPDPRSYDRIAFNLKVNGMDHVHLEKVALSDSEGEVDFTIDQNDLKFSGINGRWAEGETIKVPCMTLKGLLDKHGFERIDAMKIDVEGHEDQILMPFFESCDKSLWPKYMIIEAIEREGLPDCIQKMHELGYEDQFKTRANLCMALKMH